MRKICQINSRIPTSYSSEPEYSDIAVFLEFALKYIRLYEQNQIGNFQTMNRCNRK